MEYIKLKEDGTFDYEVPTYMNTEWDDNHLCPPDALTPEEAEMFRVVKLYPSEVPAYAPLTQRVERDGVELVEGLWMYKWKIVDIPLEDLILKLELTKVNALKKFPLDVDQILLAKIGQRLGEYTRAEVDARAYLEAQALDSNAPVPRKVSGHAAANGLTPVTAATDILTQAEALIYIEDTIRDVRLLRQAQTRGVVLGESPTRQEIATAIESVNAIVGAWEAFISALRTQLGV